MGMRGIDFKLETVTALFMHGFQVDRNTRVAELRPASVDGVTRYWYRAMLGAHLGLGEIRQREARVLGSAESGAGVAFVIESRTPGKRDRPLLPQHAGGGQPRGGGGGGRSHPSPSPSIDPGHSFTLRLLRPRASFPESDLVEAAWAFWAAVHLGGFGQRARRGAGSLRILEVEPAGGSSSLALPPATPDTANSQALARFLGTGLAAMRLAVRATNGVRPKPRSFPWLAADLNEGSLSSIQVVDLGEGVRDEQGARAAVMRGLQRYKSPVFGLPYMKEAPGDPQIKGGSIRHASPVWIHIHRGGGPPGPGPTRFLSTVTWLPSDSLGTGIRGISQEQVQRLHRYLEELPGTRVQVGGGA